MNLDRLSDTDLTGQVAIVTGGGRGLGKAIAQALAEAGASVAVISRTESELRETVVLIERAGGQAIALVGDVTDKRAGENAVKETEQRLGPVDLLVNNAGIFRCFGYTWEVDPEDWWRVIEVNLRGPFLYAHAVLPGMVARRHGRIINIASGAGLGAITGATAYAISKTAVIRLTECLEAEARGQGITVFAMDPGTLRTPMNEQALELMDQCVSTIPENDRAQHPVAQATAGFRRIFEEGRDSSVERAAQLALLLASGQADPLSGRFVSASGNVPKVEEMLQRIEEIQQQDLYKLRLRR